MKKTQGVFSIVGVIGFAFSLMMVGGCAEPAGSGVQVSIPDVSVACTTSRCRSSGPGTAYVTYTTSGCTNPSFGETASGSTTVTCTGAGCSGTVTSFINLAGSSIATVQDGTYSICVTIDFNGNYGGVPTVGDTTGSKTAAVTAPVGGPSLITVTSFSDL